MAGSNRRRKMLQWDTNIIKNPPIVRKSTKNVMSKAKVSSIVNDVVNERHLGSPTITHQTHEEGFNLALWGQGPEEDNFQG